MFNLSYSNLAFAFFIGELKLQNTEKNTDNCTFFRN